MKLDLFIESQACAGRRYCQQCRDKDGGRKYREGWAQNFELPAGKTDFDCPFGIPWGFKPEVNFITAGEFKGESSPTLRAERTAICDVCPYAVKRGGVPVTCQKYGHLDAYIGNPDSKCDNWSSIPAPAKVTQAERILITNYQSPGDITMLTAAIRDLKKAHPDRFDIYVRTGVNDLFQNNPYCKFIEEAKDPQTIREIRCHYPLIQHSNQKPYHFIHGFRKYLEEQLGVPIPMGDFKGDIHLADYEKTEPCQLANEGYRGKFWIMMAGGKNDYTAKWWPNSFYQAVVDHFKGKITFVQCGERGHWHKPLTGVINMLNKTTCREFIKLMYHAEGVVCPVTFAMHLAAAVETRPNAPKLRPCVVIAGGREPDQWEKYNGHAFLSNVGRLKCCSGGGCWRSRCQTLGDGDSKDTKDLCEQPVQVTPELRVPKCMHMITPQKVIEAIEEWYTGGALNYAN